jgi:hypothetical protein
VFEPQNFSIIDEDAEKKGKFGGYLKMRILMVRDSCQMMN